MSGPSTTLLDDGSAAPFDAEAVRAELPTLGERPYGKTLVYLDSAATSQKPQVVIDALVSGLERVQEAFG
jgi:cysteine desulfurase/selenocysteine lyase